MTVQLSVTLRKNRDDIVRETAIIESVYARSLYDSDEPEQLLLSWMEIKPDGLKLKNIDFSEGVQSEITYEYKNPMWE